MTIHIQLEDLEDLDTICWCVNYGLTGDKIHPNNREKTKKMLEKLRNDLEEFRDLKREQD